MNAPVERCPSTVPRTQGSVTVTCAAAGRATKAANAMAASGAGCFEGKGTSGHSIRGRRPIIPGHRPSPFDVRCAGSGETIFAENQIRNEIKNWMQIFDVTPLVLRNLIQINETAGDGQVRLLTSSPWD
jgi:hypothetical protein